MIHMNKRILCLMMALILMFGSGFTVAATSKSEVQKQQTETKNKLNQINKDINAIESKKNQGVRYRQDLYGHHGRR